MSWVESSAGGIGTSLIEVSREAVEGYELAHAVMMDKRLAVSKVVGISLAWMDWNRSGFLEWSRRRS